MNIPAQTEGLSWWQREFLTKRQKKKQGNGGESLADIKTKDAVKGTIKTIDKAAVAGQRMKQAYVQTKEKAEHATHAQESSAEEYAADRVEGGVDRLAHEAAYQFDKLG